MAADAIPQPALAGPGVLLHAAAPGLSIPALTQWFYRCAHSCPLSITELQAMSTAPHPTPLLFISVPSGWHTVGTQDIIFASMTPAHFWPLVPTLKTRFQEYVCFPDGSNTSLFLSSFPL